MKNSSVGRIGWMERKVQEWELPHAWAYTYGGQLQVIPKTSATQPPIDPPPPPPTNFPPLLNGGFELGFANWTPYRMDGLIDQLLWEERDITAPGMDSLAIHVAPGYPSQKAIMVSGNWRCWRGGVWQRLPDVPIGAHVRVGMWAITYGSVHPGVRDVDVRMNSKFGIGFDPLGLTDASAGRIDWKLIGGGDTTGNIGGGRDPKWQYMEHETVTTTNALTVFLNLDLGCLSEGRADWPMDFTRGHIDDVTLEVLP